jgi:hypothetical protein
MIVLVANVGERDLYYNVGTKEKPNFCHCEWGKPDMDQLKQELACRPGARHVGKAILDSVQRDPNKLERCHYPILRTVLDQVGETQEIDLLVLVVTDQPSMTKPEYRDRDSVYTGQVLQQLITRDFGDRVHEIRLQRYYKAPSRAESYDFFGDLLPQVAPRKRIERFHASLSGGIPALNASLQEQSLRIYRGNCSLYEVEAPDENSCRTGAERGTIRPVSISPFLRDVVISLVEQLIARYDYRGALEVLNTFRGVQFWNKNVDALLRHAEHRLNFNFDKAADALAAYQHESPLGQWHDSARKPALLDKLIETYFIAELRYKNQEYVDMIWRISAFYENGLRFVGAHTLSMPHLLQMKHIPKEVIRSSLINSAGAR